MTPYDENDGPLTVHAGRTVRKYCPYLQQNTGCMSNDVTHIMCYHVIHMPNAQIAYVSICKQVGVRGLTIKPQSSYSDRFTYLVHGALGA